MSSESTLPKRGSQLPSHDQMASAYWKAVYEATRQVWEARVKEVQDQQHRVASVLTANGLLLRLLGAAVGLFKDGERSLLPVYLLLSALCALALWPRISTKGGARHTHNLPLFLDASQIVAGSNYATICGSGDGVGEGAAVTS